MSLAGCSTSGGHSQTRPEQQRQQERNAEENAWSHQRRNKELAQRQVPWAALTRWSSILLTRWQSLNCPRNSKLLRNRTFHCRVRKTSLMGPLLKTDETTPDEGLKLPQRCKWDLHSSGMLRSVDSYLLTFRVKLSFPSLRVKHSTLRNIPEEWRS